MQPIRHAERALRTLSVAVVLLHVGAWGDNAPPTPPAPVAIHIRGDTYTASFDLRRIFDAALKEKLKSGLTTRVVLRSQILDVDANEVRALTLSEYRVLYRVWDEDYVVRHWTTLGERTFKARRYRDVVRRISSQRAVPVASRADLPQGGRYQAVIHVEIDPVSEDLVEKVREYLTNPGGHRQESGARGLFGNLARIFFDPRSGMSGATLQLRSALFGAALPANKP